MEARAHGEFGSGNASQALLEDTQSWLKGEKEERGTEGLRKARTEAKADRMCERRIGKRESAEEMGGR